jgi:simple sugar transport system permease protein
MALLLTSSLGIAVAFRGGIFNLGGEGQIYIGGLAASVALLAAPGLPGSLMLSAAALAASVTGCAMGGVCGLLKRRLGANELITTFLLSGALTPAADYFIVTFLRDDTVNLLASRPFDETRLLPRLLPPSSLSLSFIIALLLVWAGRTFLNSTGSGYRFLIAGAAPSFARFGGIEPEKYWAPSLAVSGALNGLAGFFAVAGTYGRCHVGFPGGLGWNAIACALIARNQPLALAPAALVYSWLKAGADSAILTTGMDFETSSLLQAVVLILATVRISAGQTGRRL